MKLLEGIAGVMVMSAAVATPALAEQPMPPPEAELSTRMAPLAEQQLGEAAGSRAAEYRARAQHYRSLGGWAYKVGLVRSAEWQAARYEAEERAWLASAAGVQPAPLSPEAAHYARLATQYRVMGGSAYRTGLVDWAEREARRHGQRQPGWTVEGVGIPMPVWYKPWLHGGY